MKRAYQYIGLEKNVILKLAPEMKKQISSGFFLLSRLNSLDFICILLVTFDNQK